MGVPVSVDSDDLEILLHAAAVPRKIEELVRSFADDPAVLRLKSTGKIGEALDRVNRQRAHAMRGMQVPDALPDEHVTYLFWLSGAGPLGYDLGGTDKNMARSLATYGLVALGQENTVVNWGDKTQTAQANPNQRIKITADGRAWLDRNGVRPRLPPQQPPKLEHQKEGNNG